MHLIVVNETKQTESKPIAIDLGNRRGLWAGAIWVVNERETVRAIFAG